MIYDEKYWEKHERKVFHDTIEMLTQDFGISVSGAESIFIKGYVNDFVTMWKGVSRAQRINFPMNLAAEAAGKFMMSFYGFYNIHQMNRAIYNGKKIQF